MLTAEENDLLCRVEGDAPMGHLMRRHWMPACMIGGSRGAGRPSGARADAGRGPRRLSRHRWPRRRARRTLSAPARFAAAWPQRGMRAALSLSRLENGRRRQRARDRVRAAGLAASRRRSSTRRIRRARPAASSGSTWARPRQCRSSKRPRLRRPPDTRVAIVKVQVSCNWAQILEGAIDSAHSSSLHSTDIPPARGEQTVATGGVWARPTADKSPRIQVQRTNYGMRYAAIRRPIMNAAANDYVRITTFVAPITVLIPPNNVYSLANVNVPMDDTHTMFYFIAWSNWGPGVDTGSVSQILRRADRDRSRRPAIAASAPATTITCRIAAR